MGVPRVPASVIEEVTLWLGNEDGRAALDGYGLVPPTTGLGRPSTPAPSVLVVFAPGHTEAARRLVTAVGASAPAPEGIPLAPLSLVRTREFWLSEERASTLWASAVGAAMKRNVADVQGSSVDHSDSAAEVGCEQPRLLPAWPAQVLGLEFRGTDAFERVQEAATLAGISLLAEGPATAPAGCHARQSDGTLQWPGWVSSATEGSRACERWFVDWEDPLGH